MRIEREELRNNSAITKKSIRKEREKARESNQKRIREKLVTSQKQIITPEPDENISQTHKHDLDIDDINAEKDIFKTYKPKGLTTSQYPKKA